MKGKHLYSCFPTLKNFWQYWPDLVNERKIREIFKKSGPVRIAEVTHASAM